MDASVKENVKSEKEQAQNIQEIKDTMKRSNIRIIELEEGKSTYAKGTENKIMEKKLPKLMKEVLINVQEACRTSNRWDQ